LAVLQLPTEDIHTLCRFKAPIVVTFAVSNGSVRIVIVLDKECVHHHLYSTKFFKGGSLIAPDVILTAAHCAGGQYKAVIGRYDLGMTDGDAVPVKRELLHPRYNPSTTNNDFNLVFLTRQTTANVHIVKLNKEASIPSHRDPVEVMGW
jgi:secreted trypsin-like serine protease